MNLLLLLFITAHLNSFIKAGKLSEKNFPQVDADLRSKSNSVLHSTLSPTAKQLKPQGVKILEKHSVQNPTKTTHGSNAAFSGDFSPNPYLNLPQTPYPFPFSFPMPIFSSLFHHNYSPFSPASKIYPFLNFSPLLPIPFMPHNQEMIYTPYADTLNFPEDTMSRASGADRRPPTNHFSKNSPIYYLRLPPTPYMFLPSFNYPTSSGFSPLLSYPPVSTFHALPMSSMFNLPLNFLGNGRPSGIYRIDGIPNEFNNMPLTFPATDSNLLSNSYRPSTSDRPSPPLEFESSPSTPSTEPESKLTYLKQPFLFNGRPDDIFILPNNFNPNLFSERTYY